MRILSEVLRLVQGSRHDAPPDRRAYVAADLEHRDELLRLFDPREGLIIFDIGACEGEDSVRYARLFPNAIVFAVEPVPANVERCQATFLEYQVANVKLVQSALSNVDGTSILNVSSGTPPGAPESADWDYGNKSSSLLQPERHLEVHPWVRFDATMTVRTQRLDTLCQEMGVSRVDFAHIDVQGAELLVLEGAGSLLGTLRAVWLEVEAIPLYSGQPLSDDIGAYLESRGFAKRIDTVGRVSGDQLWVRQ